MADAGPGQQPVQPPAAMRIRKKEEAGKYGFFIIITKLVNKLKKYRFTMSNNSVFR